MTQKFCFGRRGHVNCKLNRPSLTEMGVKHANVVATAFVAILCLALMIPCLVSSQLLMSEYFDFGSPDQTNWPGEYLRGIEIFNPTDQDVALSNWELHILTNIVNKVNPPESTISLASDNPVSPPPTNVFCLFCC